MGDGDEVTWNIDVFKRPTWFQQSYDTEGSLVTRSPVTPPPTRRAWEVDEYDWIPEGWPHDDLVIDLLLTMVRSRVPAKAGTYRRRRALKRVINEVRADLRDIARQLRLNDLDDEDDL